MGGASGGRPQWGGAGPPMAAYEGECRVTVTSACLARGLTLTLDGSVQVKRPTPVVTSYSGLADQTSGYEGDER